MTPAELCDAARSWWRRDGDRAKRERNALAVGDGDGVQAREITGWRYAPAIGRWAFAGNTLGSGDPIHEKWVGRRTTVQDGAVDGG
ncbi:MAG TPA: hypothetical protein VGI64_17885 [Streptosporangiaceae bacterium]|jgi:hypothetical protein